MRKARRNWNTGNYEDMPGKSLLSRSATNVESSVACLALKFKTYKKKRSDRETRQEFTDNKTVNRN
jgi:hypothetical protein